MSLRKFLMGGFFGVLLLVVAVFVAFEKGADGRLHVVFCDVGQGDAILIKTPSGKDVLIDGGPNDKVLDCLSNNLSFWDRTIEMVFLTHPQADHLTGLIPVLERYNVDYFVAGQVGNKTEGYKKLVNLVKEKNISVENPFMGKEIDFGDGAKISILWPEREWLSSHVSYLADISESVKNGQGSQLRPAEPGYAGQAVLGAATFRGDLNETSTVMTFSFGGFDALLTGDADSEIQPEILRDNQISQVEVLKVPHHGSRTALLNTFLETVKPSLAVISVGKNNRYGHPAGEIIERLKNLGIEIKRTDTDGEVEVVSDGKSWYTR